MRTLVAVAATIFLSTGALACEMDDSAQAAPDPSIAAKKDAAPVAAGAATPAKKTTVAAKPKKDPAIAASVAPKPAYFSQRAAAK